MSTETIPTSKSRRSINFPDTEKSLFLKYQEKIDIILDNPDEPNLILQICISDFPILKCMTLADFTDDILKPIIQKAANKRRLT